MGHYAVAIVGAGASGALVAAHLHRTSPSLPAAIVDAGDRAARGLAYGTPYGAHLLNVPAGRMSALADEPDHFLTWLCRRDAGAHARTFAPRATYGDYLGDVLQSVSQPPSRLVRVPGAAVGLTRAVDGEWVVHLHDGRQVRAARVVLALGNLPPADPLRLGDSAPRRYMVDPWAPGVAQGLASDAPLLIIGTGLTMVDVVLALRAEGHTGHVHAVSLRGTLPLAHASHVPRSLAAPSGTCRSPRAVLHWLRGEAALAAREGADWRAVVDGLRPHTQAIWQAWTQSERASFLRHARAIWDIHRHRAAPSVANAMHALIEQGSLTVHAGRVRALAEHADGIEATYVGRGSSVERRLQVARVINCTGPASDYAALPLPIVAQLRRAGWLVPDPLRLGIETDGDGRVLGSDGSPVPGLLTIGPLRKPLLWETIAIPEIRQQAAALAQLIAADAASGPARATA